MTEKSISKTSSFDVCSICKKSCCQDAKPPLTKTRMEIIVEYLNGHRTVEPMFSHEDYSFPSVDQNGFCVFYKKETKKCMIHDVKPETCQAGPITFDINLKTMKVEWFLKESNLCVFAGKLSENAPEVSEHLAAAKLSLVNLIRELEDEDLRAILKIEEPETFKISEDQLPKEIFTKLLTQK